MFSISNPNDSHVDNDTGLLNEADQYWAIAGEPRLAQLNADIPGALIHRNDLSSNQLSARQAALNNERRAIRRVLCRLDASLNDLQPVNSLPSEVLTHIFMFTVDAYSRQPRKTLTQWPTDIISTGWIALSKVCRRWRSEALACLSLWSRITTTMPHSLLDTFIQRSKDSSLDLIVDRYIDYEISDRLEVVLTPAVLDRAKSVYVTYGALEQPPREWLERLTQSMPRLEAFTYRLEALHGEIATGADVELPHNLFSGCAPRLRQFTLEFPSSIPQYFFFNQLQKLSVKTQPGLGFTPPSLERMLEILELTPELEALELVHTLPTVEPPTRRRANPIFRPRLRTLILEGSIQPCICVVRELRVSSDCTVDIKCDNNNAPVESIANLIDALTDAGIKGLSPRSLCAVSGTGSLHVAAYEERFEIQQLHRLPRGSSPSNFGFFPPEITPLFHLVIQCTSPIVNTSAVIDNTPMATHIAAICTRFFSLDRLESLSAYVDMREDVQTGGPTAGVELHELWSSVLGPCAKLRNIHCAGAPAYVLLRELATPYEAGQMLPALETLCIDEDRLSRALLYEGMSLYELLLHALQHRHIPNTIICEWQPYLVQTDINALAGLTSLTFFERLYEGETTGFMGPLPDDFFEFAPNVMEMDVDEQGEIVVPPWMEPIVLDVDDD